jgi:hypothetical protein
MNYLQSFLDKKKRAQKGQPPTDKADRTGFVSFVSDPLARFEMKSALRDPREMSRKAPGTT